MSTQALGSRAILGRLYMRLTAGSIGWIDRLSFYVDSDQEEEHKWLGMTPQMREWIGGRLIKGLRDFGVKIQNKDFEASIGIGLNEIRRNKTQQIMSRVDGLASRANTHGARLLSDLIIAGESTVCYDGEFFFDTDHSEGDSGTQSNLITVDISALPAEVHGSITNPSVEEMQQAMLQGVQTMFGFKDDQGEPINELENQFVAMVPTGLWSSGVTAVSASQLAAGQTNVIPNLPNFSITVVPSPRLTWSSDFALFGVSGNDGVAPFIRQEEQPLNVSVQAEGSPEEFHNKRHVYGVDYTGNFGPGFWQKAVKVKLA